MYFQAIQTVAYVTSFLCQSMILTKQTLEFFYIVCSANSRQLSRPYRKIAILQRIRYRVFWLTFWLLASELECAIPRKKRQCSPLVQVQVFYQFCKDSIMNFISKYCTFAQLQFLVLQYALEKTLLYFQKMKLAVKKIGLCLLTKITNMGPLGSVSFSFCSRTEIAPSPIVNSVPLNKC